MRFLIHENGLVVEKEATDATELNLEYDNKFIVCRDVTDIESLHQHVSPAVALGLFQRRDTKNPNELAGYGFYRVKKGN